jgi:hypothetical protein
VPTWATPSWEGEWSGDPAQALDAIEAVETVLRERGHTPKYTQITLDWEDGHREESSVEDARAALRFTRRPKEIYGAFNFGPDADEWVSVQAREIGVRVSPSVRARARGKDFDFAQRLVDAAKQVIEPEEPPEQDEHLRIEGMQVSQVPSSSRGKALAWVENHQGLIAVVGIVEIEAGTGIERPGLNTLMSRLRREGEVTNANRRWTLAQ